MSNRIIYDWLTMVTKIHTLQEVKEMLGLAHLSWALFPGRYCYMFRESYDNMVHIYYGGTLEMGICVEFSGQGCRIFESLGTGDYNGLFRMMVDKPAEIWLTRLDIAYDDFNNMDMQRIVDDTLAEHYVTRFRQAKLEAKLYGHGVKGWSCTFGSSDSRVKIRIYDKKTEQESREFLTVECPEGTEKWVRVEIQFRKERAKAFLEEFEKQGFTDEALEKIYLGIISQYLRLVDKPEAQRGKGDTDKRRWPTTDYWQQFTDNVQKISLYKADETPYTIDRAKENVFRRQFGSVKAMSEAMGAEEFLQVVQDMPYPPNPKYRQMVEQFKENEKKKAKENETFEYSEDNDELRF